MSAPEPLEPVVLDPRGGAFFPDAGVLAVADLHVGYEATLRDGGAALPADEVATLRATLDALLDAHRPDVVVLAGDVKHAFGRLLLEEAHDVRAVCRRLAERAPRVVLVEGNHDAGLAKILPEMEVVPHFDAGAWRFAHGHLARAKGPRPPHLCVGHEHPALGLRDEIGVGVRLRAFLRHRTTRGEESLVLPALSPWAAGYDVLRASPFLGPALAGRDRARFRVHAIADDEVLDFGEAGRLRQVMGAPGPRRPRRPTKKPTRRG